MAIRQVTTENAPIAASQIASVARVAVDTEFHAERRYFPTLLLVQVHVEGGDTWIFDPLQPELLQSAAAALMSTTWIVHGGEQDLKLLLRFLGGLPDRVLDTQLAAGLVTDRYPASLAWIAEFALGVSLEKSQTLSDWSVRPLTAAQLAYAADDVVLLPSVWDALWARAAALGRHRAVVFACDEALDAARGGDWVVRGEPWREVHGTVNLTDAALSVAVSLHRWRDRVAAADNQPSRSVLPDSVLLDLSRRTPSDVEGLLVDRRIHRSVAKRWGRDIVAAIDAGRAERPPLLVRRHTAAWRQAQWLELVAEVACAERSAASRLVMPRALVEACVVPSGVEPESAVSNLLGWRHEIVGARVSDALRGVTWLGCGAGGLVLRDDFGRPLNGS
jgi:ribonuclease D